MYELSQRHPVWVAEINVTACNSVYTLETSYHKFWAPFTVDTSKRKNWLPSDIETSYLNISPPFTVEYFPFLVSKTSTRISTPFLRTVKTSNGIYTNFLLLKTSFRNYSLSLHNWNVCPLSTPSYC